jgi:hypothetical protein
VKSDGDFEDILASDNPDVWISHRPAEGGEAGAMLAKLIERAAALKAGVAAPERQRPARGASSEPRTSPPSKAVRATKKTAAAAKSKTAAKKKPSPATASRRASTRKARA